jgi:hypothetical protein
MVQLEKSRVAAFRSELDQMLTTLARKHGFDSAQTGIMRYNDTKITVGVTVVVDATKAAEEVLFEYLPCVAHQ